MLLNALAIFFVLWLVGLVTMLVGTRYLYRRGALEEWQLNMNLEVMWIPMFNSIFMFPVLWQVLRFNVLVGMIHRRVLTFVKGKP